MTENWREEGECAMAPIKPRVVVTGVGIVSPLGLSASESWDAAAAGRSGIKDIPESQRAAGVPVTAAGLVPPYEACLSQIVDAKVLRRNERFIHLALLAAHDALSQACLTDAEQAEARRPMSCVLGVGFGGLSAIEEAVVVAQSRGYGKLSPLMVPRLISSQAAGMLSLTWGMQGEVLTVNTACASGTDAIGVAYRLIREGRASIVLAGGVESVITPLALGSFYAIGALAPDREGSTPDTISRPFDTGRTGFVMGEGAGMLVLESEEHARARGAQILAVLSGYGASADAYHPTAIEPTGAGARRAVYAALAESGLQPRAIQHINTHGTGTVMNDGIEAALIRDIFGTRADLLLTATKSLTGHMLGGTGAVEAALTVLSLMHQQVLPTANLASLEPLAEGLHFAHNSAVAHEMRAALSQSFGFGGTNAALIFETP